MPVRRDFSETDARTLIFRLADELDQQPAYVDVVNAIELQPGETPSSMVRRIYHGIASGLDVETDLEYLVRIGGFPPQQFRQDAEAHAAAAQAARDAWTLSHDLSLDERQRAVARAAARFWTALSH
jgi:hypothetical protein